MDKHFTKYFDKHTIKIGRTVRSDIKMVIPVYLEEDYLFKTINSVYESIRNTNLVLELILVFNYSDQDTEENKARQHALKRQVELDLISDQPQLQMTLLEDYDIPKKHAGVGHARKTGMDYAAYCFAKVQDTRGIICSLDADSSISDNYFNEVQDAFDTEGADVATIYFEHPIGGDFDDDTYDAIAQYELHLRYYLQALLFSGFHIAIHTVGSCFAITADAYVRAGGMPRKQAGEDFYFLQKAIQLGKVSRINSCCVYPSSRISDRVPFGTGPSVNTIINSGEEYLTYNLQAFIDLKEFLAIKDQLYQITEDAIDDFVHQLSGRMRSYLVNSDFFRVLQNINSNCSSLKVFKKRFYEVFSAFRVVKYLNYTHAHFLEKTPVFDASLSLYEMMTEESPDVFENSELLELYRQLEK